MSESSAWRDRTGQFVRYLEVLAPLLAGMKRKSIEMLRLRPGAAVLEVGCGLGFDAEAMMESVAPSGRVVGIDTAPELIAQAIERTQPLNVRPEFRVGNALALDFADDSFDACRADRVLQHLLDPAAAVAEMVRVTRPGGRVGLLDPDWYTFAIAGGNVHVAQQLTTRKARLGNSQGDIGRRLPQLLLDAGCTDLAVDAEVLVLRDLGLADFLGNIRNTLDAAIAGGEVAADAGEAWWDSARQLDARGGFVATINGVICAGTVP
jgi:SAM-dependent methyltransferase